jgi:predicted metal-dependent hydrolase
MNTRRSLFKIGGVEVSVLHKDVKNLHLNVLPPVGKVRVSAPFGMNDDAIRTFLATRISWIKKKQANFKSQERQTQRRYVSGESHYFLGKRYRLKVVYVDEKPSVVIKSKKKIILNLKPRSNVLKRERVMQKWYRNELKKTLPPLIKKWQKKIGVQASFWGIRRMKTQWGTCDEKTKRLWFNLELVKKPESCIQYVVVHELVHLVERRHDEKFISLMDKYLPKWRSEKDDLNQLILSHEEWGHSKSKETTK